MPMILVTNDDGISSPGIRILAETLKSTGDVCIVAPETEQSAVAHALTLHRPLKFEKAGSNRYMVNGTPTDCVIIGVHKILSKKPDIIVSGINNGANLGDNITYSGTVAAAIEGTLLGIPSIAVSLVTNDREVSSHSRLESMFSIAADFAGKFAEKVLEVGLPGDTLLNVNVPYREEMRGVRITRQGKLTYDNGIQDLRDPRGRECFWIGGGEPQWETAEKTDLDAVHNGYVSVTPVHLDLTNYEALKYMEENWKF